MILYFSGTGNSLATARKLAEKLDDGVMSLYAAAKADLSGERRVGLVYPTYMMNAPVAVRALVPEIGLSKDAYVYIVITCGAQTNNAVWSVRKLLEAKGVSLVYCNKIRFPDTAGVAYGRNPNAQIWKFEKYAHRLDEIVGDVRACRHALHYGGFDPVGWVAGLEWVSSRVNRNLTPKANPDKCVGCGLCAKLCRQDNISLEGGRAVTGDGCTMCLACLHFCPHQAMELCGRATKASFQYHHPDVAAKDLMK